MSQAEPDFPGQCSRLQAMAAVTGEEHEESSKERRAGTTDRLSSESKWLDSFDGGTRGANIFSSFLGL